VNEELKTRFEVGSPADGAPSDGSRGGHDNYPHALDTLPGVAALLRGECCPTN
jgi:hypothetical protein